MTYSAPFTFPWLETSTGSAVSGITFTAGKHGKYTQLKTVADGVMSVYPVYGTGVPCV